MNLVLLTRFLPILGTKSIRFSSSPGYMSPTDNALRRHRMAIGEREAIRVMLFFEYLVSDYSAFYRFISNSRRSSSRRIATLANAVSYCRQRWFDGLVRNGSFMVTFIDFLRENTRIGHCVGDVINDSFTWAHTPEGQTFWEDMNHRLYLFITNFDFSANSLTGLSAQGIRREFCRMCLNQSSFLVSGNDKLNSDLDEMRREDERLRETIDSIQSDLAQSAGQNSYGINYANTFASSATYTVANTTAAEFPQVEQIRVEPVSARRVRRNLRTVGDILDELNAVTSNGHT